MAVSQVDPTLIYGLSRGQLQRTSDGGTNWEVVDSGLGKEQVIGLIAAPKERDTLYATTSAGILVSRDQGKSWTKLGQASDFVTALGINPSGNQEMLAFSQAQGLAKSTDGGANWSKLPANLGSSPILYLAYSKPIPGTVYALNQSLEIYKTADSGTTWQKVR